MSIKFEKVDGEHVKVVRELVRSSQLFLGSITKFARWRFSGSSFFTSDADELRAIAGKLDELNGVEKK